MTPNTSLIQCAMMNFDCNTYYIDASWLGAILSFWSECAQREIESMENSAEKDKLRPKRPVPPRPKPNQLIKAGITPSSVENKPETCILTTGGGFNIYLLILRRYNMQFFLFEG